LDVSSSIDLEFQKQDKFIRIGKEEFSKLPNISIDYAILENSLHTYTAEFLGKWSDVGSWNSLRELNFDRKENNSLLGENIYSEDSRNNLVYSQSRTIGISGIEDIAIIDTPDALLVTNLNKREDANKILNKIKESDDDIFYSNKRVYRPWGWYESIDAGDNYQVKRIHVYPYEQLSVQSHFHRSERWVVIKGDAEVTVGDDTKIYEEGSMIAIGKEEIHSLSNPTSSYVEIIEVQLGNYLGEDDIVRYSDKYGRN
jgi:mannose-1-phosphate guanylyltransferase/mannose-6-phosphate isomerase